MKTIIRTIFVALTAYTLLISCSANAADNESVKYGAIKMAGVDLKAAPDAKSETVAPTAMGEIYVLTGEPSNGYVKATNLATGQEGYVETICFFNQNYPLKVTAISENEVSEPYLINKVFGENGESTTGWAFWKSGDGIKAMKSVELVYNDGRSRTFETYYNGTAKDGYLILDEEVSYGMDEGEKLETPIIVWQDITDQAGVFIDGKLYMDAARGYDTDDWE